MIAPQSELVTEGECWVRTISAAASRSSRQPSGGYYCAYVASTGTLYVDGADMYSTNIYINGGTAYVSGNAIHNNNYGIYQSAGTSYISGNSFTYNTSYAVYAPGGSASLTGNVFQNNGTNIYPAGACGTNGNVCDPSGTIKYGTLQTDVTWPAASGPYIIALSFTIPAEKTLTIEEGSVVKLFATSSKLTVEGTLRAYGSEGNEIYFTSINDDVGGDTNGNSTSPQAGDWDALQFNSGASSTIAHAVVRYGGHNTGSSEANIFNNGGSITIDNTESTSGWTYGIYQLSGTSVISFSNLHNNNGAYGVKLSGGNSSISSTLIHDNNRGVYIDDGIVTIAGCNIYNNTYGIRYSGGDVTIDNNALHDNTSYGVYNSTNNNISALGNWWGCYTGPNTTCDYAVADNISSYVNYDPWRRVNNHSAVRQGELSWYWGDPMTWYSGSWSAGTTTWNSTIQGAGRVNIYQATSSSTADLLVSDIDDGDVPPGVYDPDHDILLNRYFLRAYNGDRKQYVTTHELGHALGLAHSYLDDNSEIMGATVNERIDLGTEDKLEYAFLWDYMSWIGLTYYNAR